uniref:uncharacterized protein LOC109963252 n=1 Tax=Monopterus albus TaxID=43700 RepID=UPI0009B437A8|nr:uncharacterized protein LOC109963252 [Monopterus albus]
MLQQNNNNNYPCLNVSGSTREKFQKCSRSTLSFPSRLELGLGDLPLIRGLRAWALCSKNRRKAGGLLGGRPAPTAPAAGRRNSTSCPKPADVYLNGEWGCMEYGLPLGLDAKQAGIRALVTIATLKTSEGSGKPQTQCLFLRTEKGSCSYSTAKPGSGVTTIPASSDVGGWLRWKTVGGGSKDTPAGRRDNGPTLPAQTGANRVRVRSGRRWRKSGNAAGYEKPTVSRERQQRSGGDPAGENTLKERQEEQDKGVLDSTQFPNPQKDSKRAQQEDNGAYRSSTCCHSALSKTCTQCGRGSQGRGRQEEHEGGEIQRSGTPLSMNTEVKGMKKRQTNEEEEKEGLCESSNPELESNCFHLETLSGSDVVGIREAKSNEELKAQTSYGKGGYSEKEPDTNNDQIKQWSVLMFVAGPYEDISASTCPACPCTAFIPGSSAPVEGSICTAEHEACWGQQKQGSNQEEHCQQGEADPWITGEEEPDVSRYEAQEPNFAADNSNTANEELNKKKRSQFFFKNGGDKGGDTSICETENSSYCRTAESDQEATTGDGLDPEAGEFWRRECTCSKLDDGSVKVDNNRDQHTEDEMNVSAIQEGDYKEVKRSCSPRGDWRLQESADEYRKRKKEDADTCGQTSITGVKAIGKTSTNATNVACADLSTSPVLSLHNPAPSLLPLGSMATGLPCLVVEEVGDSEEVRVTARDREGGEGEMRNHWRELEEQDKEDRGSAVATEEGSEEEEDRDEDEFGEFMQSEEEPAWIEGFTMSASVPCGSREPSAAGSTEESAHWTPGWTDSSFRQSDDTWAAFPQDWSDESQDVGQWWQTSAVEERRDRPSANPNLAAVFAEAFPSLPGDTCDLDTVPTLSQLLTGRVSQDQGLLDSFHDLNKMIGQSYKRANDVSRNLLLKTLHPQRPHTESRLAPWTANPRLSPGLPLANQHAQNAAAKRRLSYDCNRNIME